MYSMAPSELAGLLVLGAIGFAIITVLALCLPGRGKAHEDQRIARSVRERRSDELLRADAQFADTERPVDRAAQGGGHRGRARRLGSDRGGVPPLSAFGR